MQLLLSGELPGLLRTLIPSNPRLPGSSQNGFDRNVRRHLEKRSFCRNAVSCKASMNAPLRLWTVIYELVEYQFERRRHSSGPGKLRYSVTGGTGSVVNLH